MATCDTRYWILSYDSKWAPLPIVVFTVDHLSEIEAHVLDDKGLLIDRAADSLPPYQPLIVASHLDDCPYYRGEGVCVTGCHEEPRCVTDRETTWGDY